MKQLSTGVLGILGLVLLVSTSDAAAPPPLGTAPSLPPPTLPPTGVQINALRLHSVTRAPDVNGVFQIDVGVENIGSVTKPKIVVEAHASGAGANAIQQALDVPAHTVKHFVFTDPTGGPPICSLASSKDYAIVIGDGTGPVVGHHAFLHASQCSITASVSNPWNLMTPDHVEAIHENTVYADNFAIEQAPTCDKALKLKGGVVNHTASAQNGLKLVARDGSSSAVLGSSATMNVPKGGYTPTTLSYSVGSTVPAKIVLEGSGNIANSGTTIKVSASCAYSAELDPKADAAPAAPR